MTSKWGSTVALHGWGSEEEEPPLPLVPPSRWNTACPACTARGRGTLHAKHHSSHGRAPNSMEIGLFFHSPTSACAREPTRRTLGHAVSAAGAAHCRQRQVRRIPQQGSGQGVFYKLFPLSTKLLTGFSLMPERAGCVRPTLPERDTCIRQRIHADNSRLLQDFHCLLAVTQLLSAGCCSRERDSQQQNVKNCSEASKKRSRFLWNAGAWALNTCFPQCPHGRSLGKRLPHQNPNRSPRRYRKGDKRWPLHRFVLPVYADMTMTICRALLQEPSRGSCPAQPCPTHGMNYCFLQDLDTFLPSKTKWC